MRRPLPVHRNCCVSWKWFNRVWKLSLKSLSVCPSAERTYMLRYSGFSRRDLLARSTVFLSSRSCSSTRTRPGPRPLAARRVTAMISIPGSPMPWWISPWTPVISWLGSSWGLLGRLATTTVTPGSKGSWTGGGARVSKTSSRRLILATSMYLNWDQMADNFYIDHQCIYASPKQNFYIDPLYDGRKIFLCIHIFFIQGFMNVILTYDFICISILSLSLETAPCSYHSSYEHYLYRCVLCIAILSLFMLRIYSFMYWKSWTSNLLVLMSFVLQCTDYK